MDVVDDGASLAAAFSERMEDIVSACVSCGACFDKCPITGPAGLGEIDGVAVTGGIRDILRVGGAAAAPDEDAARWAQSCILDGDCIASCEHGVNPRLMLTMARMRLGEEGAPQRDRQRAGVVAFTRLRRDIQVMSRMQLGESELARLGQARETQVEPTAPDVLLYTGCNVLKTPHIALLAMDILEHLGLRVRAMGGPAHCCGILHYRAGDMQTSSRMGAASMARLGEAGAAEIISWCPSCHVQFSEVTAPNIARAEGADPEPMTPYFPFLARRLDRLRPLLVRRTPMRVALHGHRGVNGAAEAARSLLKAVPGVQLVDLDIPGLGLMSNYLKPLPELQRQTHAAILDAAERAGVDALATLYHADHRELCAHERERPFEIINALEPIAASMGMAWNDGYKRFKMMQDVDVVMEDAADVIGSAGIDEALARQVIGEALIGDQPLALSNRRCA